MAEPTHRILVIHGPNLDRLGLREPEIYGHQDLAALDASLVALGVRLGAHVETVQANAEGALVEAIHRADQFDGLVLNPAAYTHTSVALHDALRSISTPSIEVHLSNLYGREGFRQTSLTAPACDGVIMGLGFDSYALALRHLVAKLDVSTSESSP